MNPQELTVWCCMNVLLADINVAIDELQFQQEAQDVKHLKKQ